MNQFYFNAVFIVEVLGQVFGAIYRAVLTAGATERDLQVVKTSLEEPFYMVVHQFIDRFQERKNLTVLLKKINYRLVQTRHLHKLLVLAGVVGRAAIEHISASIAGSVSRYAFLIRE